MIANRLAECVNPVVEQLESRQLMSVTVSPLFQDSEGHWTLRIRGDSKNDTVAIVDDPINGEATVTANGFNGGSPTTFPYPDSGNAATGEIEVFDVDLKGGNDQIFFTQLTAYFSEPRAIHLDGDTGNDSINLDLGVGLSVDSNVTVQLDGDSGNDTIFATLGDVLASKLDLDVTAGDGNDHVSVSMFDRTVQGTAGPNYDSHVDVAVDLGSGKNIGVVDLIGTGVFADSVVDVDVRGGNSTGSNFDDIKVDLGDAFVEGKVFVDVAALGGDDKINASLDGLGLNTDNDDYAPVVLVNLNGGDGKDTIVAHNHFGSPFYEGTFVSASSFLSVTVRGGNGDDKITTDLSESTDIEAGGQLVLNVDGQNNNDTIVTTIVFADLGSGTGGGQADISIKGGQNTDNITFNANDGSTNKVVFGPSLFGPLIDGQTGTDKATVVTVGLAGTPTVRNFESSSVSNT